MASRTNTESRSSTAGELRLRGKRTQPTVTLSAEDITLEEASRIIHEGTRVALDPSALKKLAQANHQLGRFAQDHIVYGLNTGFGPMATHRISDTDRQALQYNLIRSHALGSGQPLPELFVRATLLCRLIAFMKGHSAVSLEVVDLLASFLNRRIHPVIPEHGGVGASGDLVQLAHVGLALIGEGDVLYEGQKVPARDAISKCGLTPLVPKGRDGLAILNGVSAMTGIGLANITAAENLVSWAVAASCFLFEIIECTHEPIRAELHARKQHSGQREIAAAMEHLLADSRRMRPDHMSLDGHDNGNGEFSERVQEHYSIRCVPQILGPIADTLHYARTVVVNEMNSISDNPVFNSDLTSLLHGGNFHGDYIALEMDKLKIVTTKLSMLAERQLNFLMNDHLNKCLPPFLNLGTIGLNLGMQGAQFTATSTAAENQTLAYPMYLHSIPTNKDNQDVVSMGTNAALLTHKTIQNTFEILAIEFVALLQAVEATESHTKLASFTARLYESLRTLAPKFTEDTLTGEHISAVCSHLQSTRPDILTFT